MTTSGITYGEVSALEDFGGGLLAADRGTGPVDDPRLLLITKTGLVTLVGPLDHVSKGLVFVEPPSVPVPLAVHGLLGAGLVLLGARAARRSRRS